MSSTRLAIAAVLLTGGLVWPALYNGQPLFFGDTSAYIRGADAGIQAALHHRSAWSLTGSDALAQPVVRMHVSMGNATDSIRHGSSIKDKSILYGRSPYYGALLYLGDLTGGFWLTVILQAIAVLVSLALAVRAIGAPLWPAWAIGAACVAAFTTAPFFASFLMPDVFAGIAILSAAALLADRGRLGLGGRLTAFALLALCVLFHESHPLIVGVLLLAAFTRNVLRRSWSNRRGLAAVGSALGVAVMGQIVFALLVQRVVGAPPLRPPFLMARLIEDGPGLRYLRETCPANGLEVCAYLDRLPMPANLFVWDTGPHGVFGTAVPAVRRRLAGEQLRFALAVLADHPFAQLAASVGNAASLIGMSGLAEFEYGPGEREDFAAKIPAQYLVRLQHTPAYRGALPTTVSAALSGASYALGAAVIIVALGRRKYRSVLAPPLLELAAWALAGVLANAVICGALSGPHNRYEARVVWVLPFVAVLIAFCLAATRHVACSAPVSCRTTEVEEARGG